MPKYLFTGISSNQIFFASFYTNNYAKLLAKSILGNILHSRTSCNKDMCLRCLTKTVT